MSQNQTFVSFSKNASAVARKAITKILEEEGGYVIDPNDAGGETNFGISKRWYPNVDIKNINEHEAAEIYYQDYWRKNQCHHLPPSLAYMLFDCAVNQGGSFARKSLQGALGVVQDGVIGQQTSDAAFKSTDNNQLALVTFTRLRCTRYTNLAQSKSSQVRFIEGWIDRALNVLSDSLENRFNE